MGSMNDLDYNSLLCVCNTVLQNDNDHWILQFLMSPVPEHLMNPQKDPCVQFTDSERPIRFHTDVYYRCCIEQSP